MPTSADVSYRDEMTNPSWTERDGGACEGQADGVAEAGHLETQLQRELGFLPMHVPDEFFVPLSGDELAAWEAPWRDP